MQKEILKNRPVDEKQLNIFLEKYSFILSCFNKNMKNRDIVKELNISRESFNKVQNEMFFHIAVVEPKIKEIASGFDLFFNLDKYVTDEYLILVKKCIVHFNKNISSIVYTHNSSRYIIQKNLYHSNHKLSLIKTAIEQYVIEHESSLVPISYIANYIGASSKRTKELLSKPLNSFFYLIDDFVFYCRKNNLRDYIREFKKTKVILSDKVLYDEIKSIYKEKLLQENIVNFSKFKRYLHLASCEKIAKSYTQDEVISFLFDVNRLLREKSINCFNKGFIKQCVDTVIDVDDIDYIFENYSDFIRVNKNLYSTPSNKDECKSSKAIIRSVMSKYKDFSIEDIKKALFDEGKVLKELTIKNEISTVKSKT